MSQNPPEMDPKRLAALEKEALDRRLSNAAQEIADATEAATIASAKKKALREERTKAILAGDAAKCDRINAEIHELSRLTEELWQSTYAGISDARGQVDEYFAELKARRES